VDTAKDQEGRLAWEDLKGDPGPRIGPRPGGASEKSVCGEQDVGGTVGRKIFVHHVRVVRGGKIRFKFHDRGSGLREKQMRKGQACLLVNSMCVCLLPALIVQCLWQKHHQKKKRQCLVPRRYKHM